MYQVRYKATVVQLGLSVCGLTGAYPGRPVREALHLGKHQVSWFEAVAVFPRHPAAEARSQGEGIEPATSEAENSLKENRGDI